MKRIVLDTNVYSRGMAGAPWAARILRQADELLISPIVIGELLNGFRRGTRAKHNRDILDQFLSSPRIRLLSITEDTAEFYSSILAQLQKQGTPIPTNDIWIAACAMEQGAHVATLDAHFQQITGLICVGPEE